MIHHLMLEKSAKYRENRMLHLLSLAGRLDALIKVWSNPGLSITKAGREVQHDRLTMLLWKRDNVARMLREVRS